LPHDLSTSLDEQKLALTRLRFPSLAMLESSSVGKTLGAKDEKRKT